MPNADQTNLDRAELRAQLDQQLLRTVATEPAVAGTADLYRALSQVAREQLAERWVDTQRADSALKARRVYYLSMEFLIGRTLNNALASLDLRDSAAAAFAATPGPSLDQVIECEPDAALGNGGLGRLAACFLDSMATLELPSWGYGMRYEYGMFAQSIINGGQVEQPDAWLTNGTPWEFPRPDTHYTVHFGGTAEHHGEWAEWHAADSVEAKAFDYVIPGHGTDRVSTLRLWKAAAPAQIDLGAFNTGDYARAAEFKNRFENISWVLYPNDSTPAGRELRLRQEYFFVAASMQDILARHLAEHGTFDNLAERVAIHLNDTHPAIGVAELMRVLCDEHGIAWDAAWAQCCKIFSYTNHTLMPEALEVWPMSIMEAVLPRHVQIISEINRRFIDSVHAKFPEDGALLNRVSLITHGQDPQIRMAYLSIVASHKVNGVAKLHSDLCVQTIFADFARIYPDRFTNVTNGVTPRRWLAQSNPGLAGLIDARLGREWRIRLDMLEGLASGADDAEFRAQVRAVKLDNKIRLANLIEQQTGLRVDPHALFDVQVKRIHEYKRQLLNLLHVVQRYREILEHPDKDWQPRVHLFAGKAASAYRTAKQIIRLIHDVAKVVNADGRIGDRLKVAFLPDYRVSQAEIIFPGADVSEQISTAGTEASGTGNMKFALNGALTVGTWDGANIEIAQHVGLDNIFIFGKRAEEIQALRNSGYHPRAWVDGNPDLRAVIDLIDSGHFSPDEPERYGDLMATVTDRDSYFLCADFSDYIAIQRRIDEAYQSPDMWTARVIRNIAAMGSFSSDRTIAEYCRKIWKIEPRH